MRNITLKIGAAFCACLCLTAMFFISRNVAAANGANGENALIASPRKLETRCGWFENPTPANVWLTDKDAMWLIGVQGGYQADGDWMMNFKPGQWVETNGHYGYGCACLRATTDKKESKILTVKSFTARPLSVCRRDKKLKEPNLEEAAN